jgi:predicted hotdog family 3-hydroxylacyl-ACP dehydratase
VARFVEEILESDRGRVVCRARVPENSPFVAGGRVPAFVALDVAAQAAAVLSATAGATRAGCPASPTGYLVGARDVRFIAGGFAAGEELIATVRREAGDPPLLVATVLVTWRGDEILVGSLTLYVPPLAATAP